MLFYKYLAHARRPVLMLPTLCNRYRCFSSRLTPCLKILCVPRLSKEPGSDGKSKLFTCNWCDIVIVTRLFLKRFTMNNSAFTGITTGSDSGGMHTFHNLVGDLLFLNSCPNVRAFLHSCYHFRAYFKNFLRDQIIL